MKLSRRSFLQTGSAAIIAGAAPRPAWGRTEADVVVIGAGLAGLHAAAFLERSGASVIVVEALRRVGGRVHTLRHLPGMPEAGAIQVGSGYTRLRGIARELGIALVSEAGAGAGRNSVPGNLYHVNGVTVPAAEWPRSQANTLPPALRGTEPASLLFGAAAMLPQLQRAEDWTQAAPELDISLQSALVKAGVDGEALRLMEANLNGNTLAGMSQLHLARSLAVFREGAGPVSTIADGADRLPEAMARQLANPIRLGMAVTGLREEGGRVEVMTGHGAIRARHAVCTIPFAAMRHLPLSAGITAATASMIADLPYTRASFAYIEASTPFWQEDGLPHTLWTDDPLIGRVFVLSDDPPMLKLWTTGRGADLLDRLPVEEAGMLIAQRLIQMRPSAGGRLRATEFYSWQRSPWARGIYHHIGAGMASDLAQTVTAQGIGTGARLHFAGEHLARAASGMEGALESAEATATAVARLL